MNAFIILFRIFIIHFSMPISVISIISQSVNSSNFTPVLFRQACHANQDADTKYTGSSSYILRHIFLKFSNISASNNVSL